MFPSEQDAAAAERALEEDGSGDSISLVAPQVIQEIARTVGGADIPLPSAGTEADTGAAVMPSLASQGHHALLIHAPPPRNRAHHGGAQERPRMPRSTGTW